MLRLLPTYIDEFLSSTLRIRIHPQKTRLQGIEKGIDFLGYFIKKNHTLVRQKVVRRFKAKIFEHERQTQRVRRDEREVLLQKFKARATSYKGHFSHANTYRLVKALTKNIYE